MGENITFEQNGSNHLTLPDAANFTLEAGRHAIFQRNNTGFALIAHNQITSTAVKHIAVADGETLSLTDINVIADNATVNLPAVANGTLAAVQLKMAPGHSGFITGYGIVANNGAEYQDAQLYFDGTSWQRTGTRLTHTTLTALPASANDYSLGAIIHVNPDNTIANQEVYMVLADVTDTNNKAFFQIG